MVRSEEKLSIQIGFLYQVIVCDIQLENGNTDVSNGESELKIFTPSIIEFTLSRVQNLNVTPNKVQSTTGNFQLQLVGIDIIGFLHCKQICFCYTLAS